MMRMGMTRTMRWFLRCSAALVLTVALVGVFCSDSAHAQQASRMVQGKISDTTGSPLSGAIVYLKDVRTLDVKSYITEKDGVYRFEQLSSNDDYKLWAEMDEKKSPVRTISSFDPKKSFLINLHIHTEK